MQQTTVTFVAVNELTSSKTGKKFWKAIASDNTEFLIWEPAFANVAKSLLNQSADITYTTKQNGQFTNHNITAIAATFGKVPARNGGAAPAPAPAVQPSKADQFRTPEQIIRQEAIHAASRLYSGFEVVAFTNEIRNTIESFVYYSQHGRWMDTELPVPVATGDEDWA